MIVVSQPTIKKLVNLCRSRQSGHPLVFVQVSKHKETDQTLVEYNTLFLTVSAHAADPAGMVFVFRVPLISWTSYRGEPDATDRFDNVQQVLDAADELTKDVLDMLFNLDCSAHEGEITFTKDVSDRIVQGRRFVRWNKESKTFETFEPEDE